MPWRDNNDYWHGTHIIPGKEGSTHHLPWPYQELIVDIIYDIFIAIGIFHGSQSVLFIIPFIFTPSWVGTVDAITLSIALYSYSAQPPTGLFVDQSQIRIIVISSLCAQC
ncbi:MAG: hypothetical protein LC101_03900 [Flavobacteriales bacterium]|nr:hypothetical protein [Flavobacteriales bacterium]